MGNIYIQIPEKSAPEKPRRIFFPAGLLMVLRMPLPGKTAQYHSFLRSLSATPEIKLHRETQSYLLLVDEELNVSHHPVILADFAAPLAYMTRGAEVLAKSALIPACRLFRLIILDSDFAYHRFQIFPGEGTISSSPAVLPNTSKRRRECSGMSPCVR